MRFSGLFIGCALASAGGVAADSTCKLLNARLYNKSIEFPSSAGYTSSTDYWALGPAAQRPDCFAVPSTLSEVSILVKTLVKSATPFTVKGGGHTPFAGASSRTGGVVIDMHNMAAVTLSADRRTVAVGAGARWVHVSEVLDPYGLTVIGGRVGDVGVAGLLLGGGISYFSGKYGLACDNVVEFEVVLASGAVVTASRTHNRDLYWALRGGGGSSFGVVTKFTLNVIAYEQMWSNRQYVVQPDAIEAGLREFAAMPAKLEKDQLAHMYMSFGDQAGLGTVFTPSLFHSTPITPAAWPEVFAGFRNMSNIYNETTVGSMTTIIAPTTPAAGWRQIWSTFTAAAGSADLLLDFYSVFKTFVNETRTQIDSTAIPTLIVHTLTPTTLGLTAQNGGNPLGLTRYADAVWIVQVNLQWTNETLDDAAAKIVDNALGSARAAAKNRRMLKDYIYMNYAQKKQDVLSSYGAFNLAKLKLIAAKVDFGAAMHRLWTGYFSV